MFDPPGGISAKANSMLRVKRIDGSKQAQVALFDQVAERKSFAVKALSDIDYQAKITAHHVFACLGIVGFDDTIGKFFFFFPAQKGRSVYFF